MVYMRLFLGVERFIFIMMRYGLGFRPRGDG